MSKHDFGKSGIFCKKLCRGLETFKKSSEPHTPSPSGVPLSLFGVSFPPIAVTLFSSQQPKTSHKPEPEPKEPIKVSGRLPPLGLVVFLDFLYLTLPDSKVLAVFNEPPSITLVGLCLSVTTFADSALADSVESCRFR